MSKVKMVFVVARDKDMVESAEHRRLVDDQVISYGTHNRLRVSEIEVLTQSFGESFVMENDPEYGDLARFPRHYDLYITRVCGKNDNPNMLHGQNTFVSILAEAVLRWTDLETRYEKIDTKYSYDYKRIPEHVAKFLSAEYGFDVKVISSRSAREIESHVLAVTFSLEDIEDKYTQFMSSLPKQPVYNDFW